MSPLTLNIAAHDQRLVAAARLASVERIVKLSVLSVGNDATDPITTLHRTGEEAIRDSGINWTFLRPTGFMSNALNWAPMITTDQVIYAPFAAGRAAIVDPTDIAAVAAAWPHRRRAQPACLRTHRPRSAHPSRPGRDPQPGAEPRPALRRDRPC